VPTAAGTPASTTPFGPITTPSTLATSSVTHLSLSLSLISIYLFLCLHVYIPDLFLGSRFKTHFLFLFFFGGMNFKHTQD